MPDFFGPETAQSPYNQLLPQLEALRAGHMGAGSLEPPKTGSALKDMLLNAIYKGLPAMRPGAGTMAGVGARIGSTDRGVTGGNSWGVPYDNSSYNMKANNYGDIKRWKELGPARPGQGLEVPGNMNEPRIDPNMKYTINTPTSQYKLDVMRSRKDAPYKTPTELDIMASKLPNIGLEANMPDKNFGPTPLEKMYGKGSLRPANDAPLNIHNNSPDTPEMQMFLDRLRQSLGVKEDPMSPYDKALLEQIKKTVVKPPEDK